MTEKLQGTIDRMTIVACPKTDDVITVIANDRGNV